MPILSFLFLLNEPGDGLWVEMCSLMQGMGTRAEGLE